MLVLGEGRSGYFLLAIKYTEPVALGFQAVVVKLTMCDSGLVSLSYSETQGKGTALPCLWLCCLLGFPASVPSILRSVETSCSDITIRTL